MRVRIDQQSDALYVDLTGREIESSAEVADGIIVDYDKDGRLVGRSEEHTSELQSR